LWYLFWQNANFLSYFVFHCSCLAVLLKCSLEGWFTNFSCVGLTWRGLLKHEWWGLLARVFHSEGPRLVLLESSHMVLIAAALYVTHITGPCWPDSSIYHGLWSCTWQNNA
jgi:hypothetical protein